eukprot:1183637-Prorocentrum_minimum.AAC.6
MHPLVHGHHLRELRNRSLHETPQHAQQAINGTATAHSPGPRAGCKGCPQGAKELKHDNFPAQIGGGGLKIGGASSGPDLPTVCMFGCIEC